MMTTKFGHEVQVFFPTIGELGKGQISGSKTASRGAVCIFIGEPNKTILPTRRQLGRGRIHAIGIIFKRFVERRILSSSGWSLGINVEFHRLTKRTRCVGKLAQNGLTAYDDELLFPRDTGCRPDDVLKLQPVHDGGKFPFVPAGSKSPERV